jgi:hypothetical protein
MDEHSSLSHPLVSFVNTAPDLFLDKKERKKPTLSTISSYCFGIMKSILLFHIYTNFWLLIKSHFLQIHNF